MTVDLDARRFATEKTFARYRERAFDWSKRATCLHLARAQMQAMGHKPPAIPDFRSALGARSALKRTGHATLVELFDAMLPRIAPLAMLVGDLGLLPGDGDGFEAVVVAAGGGTVLGWHGEDASRLHPIQVSPAHFLAAYRL